MQSQLSQSHQSQFTQLVSKILTTDITLLDVFTREALVIW